MRGRSIAFKVVTYQWSPVLWMYPPPYRGCKTWNGNAHIGPLQTGHRELFLYRPDRLGD